MTVTAPPQDAAGIAQQAAVAASQALVNATSPSKAVYPQYVLELNQLQVELVEHFMMTGWLNAGSNILATYSAPVADRVGKTLTDRVTFLTALVANAPAPPPGNANGYGGSGWVTVLQNYQIALYQAQVDLVRRIMDAPNGTSAATMLANLTGAQTTVPGMDPRYKFTSVGFTDVWIDD